MPCAGWGMNWVRTKVAAIRLNSVYCRSTRSRLPSSSVTTWSGFGRDVLFDFWSGPFLTRWPTMALAPAAAANGAPSSTI